MNRIRLQPRTARRHGMAAVLAMLYLMLFTVLALGFYAQMNTFAQVSQSELKITRARTAAESGLMFLRYQISQLPVITQDEANAKVAAIGAALGARLNGTGNLGSHSVEQAAVNGSTVVYIPGRSSGGVYNWIDLGETAGRFRAVLSADGAGNPVIRTYGQDSADENAITRAVECGFAGSRSAWMSPGKGVLTRSAIQISNGAKIQGGNVTVITNSTSPSVTMSGGSQIQGNIYYGPNAKPPQTSNGAKITGSITKLSKAPDFPEVDTSIFESFVPSKTAPKGTRVLDATSSIGAQAVLTNIRIKANSNISFGNSVQLNGVIYIESPNKITFGGGGRINGIIVTDNDGTKPLSGNQITIANGIKMDGVETLVGAQFEPEYRIDELKALKGALVIAPNYKVVLAGGTKSYTGSWVASEFDISNGYKGTITGAFVNLADTSFKMMGGGQLDFAGTAGPVHGLYGTSKLKIDTGSYREVTP